MPRQSRTFRVFVSSTFSDLKAERNALQEKVFPRLHDLCQAHGCRFQAIDLRWGVSEEAALDQQTMNICFTELKRCQEVTPRPNFIILLGDRYGWIPLPPQIPAGEFERILDAVPEEDRALLAYDESLTEEEQARTGWYRRDDNAVPPEYVLRPREVRYPDNATQEQREAAEEAEYREWCGIENRLREILLQAIDQLGLPSDTRIKYECSATHQEIIEGALRLPDEREHVFAFLRNIQNLDDLPPGCIYSDERQETAQELKETIRRTRGVTHFDYNVTWSGPELDSHIERFAADALASLTRIIEEEFAQLEQIDALTREDIAHREFGAERCRHFVGRQGILDDIAAYVRGDANPPLIVYGPSGSGKSALIAKAVLDAAGEHEQAQIIQRFIGATPESTDIRTLLRNLCLEVSQRFGFDRLREQELAGVTDPEARDAVMRKYEIPDEYRHLSERFREFLAMIPEDQRLILFLDALDQLSASDNAHALNWLPKDLPDNVKVVVSVLEREDDAGQCLRSARSKVPESALIRLEDMTPEEGSEALGEWLDDAKRTLTDEQMESVLAGFRRCPMPLYLKLAFEEARRWKSYDGLPCGADDVPGLAGDVPGGVGDMLARLRDKRQHGEVLVKTFLGMLSAARHGLSETEILELLSEDEGVMADLRARSARSPEAKGIPVVVWLRLYYDLQPYLVERSADNTVLLDFYHRQVGESIEKEYLATEYHARLARYFRVCPLSIRQVVELPWQLVKMQAWQDLYDLLLAPEFFVLAWDQFESDVIGYWAQMEGQTSLRVANACTQMLGNEKANWGVIFRMTELLDRRGEVRGAAMSYELLVEQFRKVGDRSNLQASIGNLGICHLKLEEYEAALQAFEEQERLARDIGHQAGLTNAMTGRAAALRGLKRPEAFQQTVRQVEYGRGDGPGTYADSSYLGAQAVALMDSGDMQGAMAKFVEQEIMLRTNGMRHQLAACLCNMAAVSSQLNHQESAKSFADEALELAKELGSPRERLAALRTCAIVATRRNDWTTALSLYREVEPLCEQLGDKSGLLLSLMFQAGILAEECGQYQEALPFAERAFQIAGDVAPEQVDEIWRIIMTLRRRLE